MGISFTDFTGGSSGANDFAISLGSSGNNVFQLDKSYAAGSYSITIGSETDFFDIYAISADGSFCGYTNTLALESSDKFNQLVVLGLPNNDQVFFEYRGEITASSSSGSVASAGAYISSVSVSSLQNINDTTTITGGNFANDIEVYFIGQSSTEVPAKNVVVVSANQLIATRPDDFDTADSPYTIKVINPGIPTPIGTNAFKLNNSVTAGTNPIWQTLASQPYTLGIENTITLIASDTEDSDIDYAITAGSLPAGLTLDGETGVISGTPSGGIEGDQAVFTVRATDAGGNFVDREFTFTANAAPTWTTVSSDIGNNGTIRTNFAISFQFVADGGSAGGILSYSVQSGNLPSGTSLSSGGLLTGTSTLDGNFVFTLRVTDEFGAFADREFAVESAPTISATGGDTVLLGGYQIHTFSASGTFQVTSAPSDAQVEYLVVAGGGGGGSGRAATGAGGGGGAGGYRSSIPGESSGGGASAELLMPVEAGDSFAVTIGAGGAANVNGSNSTFGAIASTGGGKGALGPGNGSAGGSGGGGAGGALGGAGTAGEGFRGGNQAGAAPGAGGGGAGGQGVDIDTGNYANGGSGGPGLPSSITGSEVVRSSGGEGGNYVGGSTSGNKGAGESNTGNGGGGGNGADSSSNSGAPGGSGVVIIRYAI